MLNQEFHRKVLATHLNRDAYLYVRQSSLKQVLENVESTKRQYALRDRAIAMGWSNENVHVIDNDLGMSAASAADRAGFQKLVAEVGLGRAGIVMGLEVSRLARNSTDWHKLLEICALTDTLILDEDGIYDPSQFNDRLLLGLKGTMSEAELHVLRARLRGGILNKAARGELSLQLPVGLVYNAVKKAVLDPDAQVHETMNVFFEVFKRTGSAFQVVRHFNLNGLKFPKRIRNGAHKGELAWMPITHSRVLSALHNPRYAGAFAYGRLGYRKDIHGKLRSRKKIQDEWTCLKKDQHEGFITWDQFEANLTRLKENSQAHGIDRKKSPPREGPALIQGLMVCGLCGHRMTLRYHQRRDKLAPTYVCQKDGIDHARAICQSIPGHTIDETINKILLETVTPLNIDAALSVQSEIQSRIAEADSIRKKEVDRAKYEADLSQRRFMQVDPANRLVADALEADWNKKLRELYAARERYEKQNQDDRKKISEEKKAEILELTSSFPKFWNSPQTTDRDRKRMCRLLIEDVTLKRLEQIHIGIRFKGGAAKEIIIPIPKNAFDACKTHSQIVEEIDKLLESKSDEEIANKFNTEGLLTGKGHKFDRQKVERIRQMYSLATRFDRLRKAGWLTREEICKKLDISTSTALLWVKNGKLNTKTYKKKLCLYEDPGPNAPKPMTPAESGRCRKMKQK